MKITDFRVGCAQFKDLQNGDVFEAEFAIPCSSPIYMKIFDELKVYDGDCSMNAVNLITGEALSIGLDVPVRKLNAEIVLKD